MGEAVQDSGLRGKQIAHADRLAKIGSLAAGIAHEINTPLTYIEGNAQLLNRLFDKITTLAAGDAASRDQALVLFAQCQSFLDPILEGSQRISLTVRSMVKFARRELEPKTACSMRDRIEDALRLCHNALKYHATIEKEVAPDLPDILANPPEIEQVLICLLKNAGDAVEKRPHAKVRVVAERQGDAVRVVIEDNGPGIPAELLETIWKPFFTTKGDEGIGLGLLIAQDIVEDHEGRIWAENRPEGGARFVFELPAIASGRSENDIPPIAELV